MPASTVSGAELPRLPRPGRARSDASAALFKNLLYQPPAACSNSLDAAVAATTSVAWRGAGAPGGWLAMANSVQLPDRRQSRRCRSSPGKKILLAGTSGETPVSVQNLPRRGRSRCGWWRRPRPGSQLLGRHVRGPDPRCRRGRPVPSGCRCIPAPSEPPRCSYSWQTEDGSPLTWTAQSLSVEVTRFGRSLLIIIGARARGARADVCVPVAPRWRKRRQERTPRLTADAGGDRMTRPTRPPGPPYRTRIRRSLRRRRRGARSLGSRRGSRAPPRTVRAAARVASLPAAVAGGPALGAAASAAAPPPAQPTFTPRRDPGRDGMPRDAVRHATGAARDGGQRGRSGRHGARSGAGRALARRDRDGRPRPTFTPREGYEPPPTAGGARPAPAPTAFLPPVPAGYPQPSFQPFDFPEAPASRCRGSARRTAARRPTTRTTAPGSSSADAGRRPGAPGRSGDRRHLAEPGQVEQGDGARHARVPRHRVPAHVRARVRARHTRRSPTRTTTPTRCRTPCTT